MARTINKANVMMATGGLKRFTASGINGPRGLWQAVATPEGEKREKPDAWQGTST